MKISGAKVFTEKYIFEERDLYIQGERIVSSDPGDGVVDAAGLLALPGLVDVHLHGAAGRDICGAEKDALDAVAEYEASRGILAFCPATMTLPKEETLRLLRMLASHENGNGADVIGINMEGPFLNPEKCGAQDASAAAVFDADLLADYLKAADGKVRLLSIAPECMKDISDISRIPGEVHVSLAHTACDYGTAKKAFRLRADHLTHAFNAMNGIGHRVPGPIPAAAEEGAYAEIIADGVHVHPSVIKLAVRIFGEDRTVFVSDSCAAAGMPDGEYMLGGRKVTVKEGKAVLSGDPSVIAGSAEDLFGCLRKAVSMGIALETAVRCAAVNPARSIGAGKDYGTLEAGAYANVLLLDESLEIKGIVKKGRILKDVTKA